MKALSRLGTEVSFAKAGILLHEMFDISVSTEVVRQRCLKTARRASSWQEPVSMQRRRFDPARGGLEMTVDAGKVRTKETGWRDLKLAVWTRRKPGSAAEPKQWRTRLLPPTGPRWVQTGIGPHEEFSASWAKQTQQFNSDGSDLLFIADGADWIWRDQEQLLPKSTGLLDIYHASEKLHEAGAALHGEKTAAARQWGDQATDALVAGGWESVQSVLDQEIANHPARATVLYETRAYFFKKRERLGYAAALAHGRPIGSGMVEGEAKQMNRRLKAAGVAWRERNVQAMARLCAITHSGLWETFSNRPT